MKNQIPDMNLIGKKFGVWVVKQFMIETSSWLLKCEKCERFRLDQIENLELYDEDCYCEDNIYLSDLIMRSLKSRYKAMHSRIKVNKYYENIKVDPPWVGKGGFENFKNDVYESFYEHCMNYGIHNTQIDRTNNSGNYNKENYRWVTSYEQQDNTSVQKWFIATHVNGRIIVEKNQSKFARENGLHCQAISSCLNGKKKSAGGFIFSYI